MNDYVYRDNESGMPRLTAMLTSRMGDGRGNHEAAYLDSINLLVAAFSSGSMLDIGCGMGRITLAAAGKMREVVALEPDTARWNWTREAVGNHKQVSVINLTTADYLSENPGKKFDLVVLGMVLQHLATDRCRDLMRDVAKLTKGGGMAVISSTHALERAKCFTFQKASEARVSEEEFNHYAENPHLQDKGIPVHRFSRSEFEAMVPNAFDIVQWNQYSYYRPEHLNQFAKLHLVDAEELANIGNSQFLVLKKKNDEHV